MTVQQVAAIAICGPIGLWSLTNLLDLYLRKTARFSVKDAIFLVICPLIIALSFIGVQ